MKIPSQRDRGGSVGINMTPMIDVVFQLLIFFLVSSHLAKQEGLLPLPLPSAATGEEPRESTAPRATLNVLADGTLLLAGHATSLDELPRRLRRLREEEGPDVELRLRVDRATEYARVAPVLAECAAAGIWNVAFSVVKPESGS